jgi:hypothetical protein
VSLVHPPPEAASGKTLDLYDRTFEHIVGVLHRLEGPVEEGGGHAGACAITSWSYSGGAWVVMLKGNKWFVAPALHIPSP